MSRATRNRARVVHISSLCLGTPSVDADDSEAAAVLSNFVSHCGEGNAMPTSTKLNPLVAMQHGQCRRSSRLLQFFRSENYQKTPPSSDILHKPPATQVILPKPKCASNSGWIWASDFEFQFEFESLTEAAAPREWPPLRWSDTGRVPAMGPPTLGHGCGNRVGLGLLPAAIGMHTCP